MNTKVENAKHFLLNYLFLTILLKKEGKQNYVIKL